MFVSRYIMYSMVSIAILEAVLVVLFAREKFAEKSKKKIAFYRRPVVQVAVVVAVLIATSICGLRSVYAYGNYNFVTCNKATAKELYESIVALDGGENLSIIAADPWLYYDLAAYTSYHHDVNFIGIPAYIFLFLSVVCILCILPDCFFYLFDLLSLYGRRTVLCGLLISFFAILIVALIPGTKGPNKYGPPPVKRKTSQRGQTQNGEVSQ